MNGEYYFALLDRFHWMLKVVRPGLDKKKILFHQDNAPAYTSSLTMAKLHELRFKLIKHPPYSPDLAPCGFCLFPKMKFDLLGKKFSTREDMITAVDDFFNRQDDFFLDAMKGLNNRRNKCVEVQGSYVEK